MVEQELMKIAYQERMREAARIARRSEAQAVRDEPRSTHGGRPGLRWRLTLPSFAVRPFWSKPAVAGRSDSSP